MTVTEPAPRADAPPHPSGFESPLDRQVFDQLAAEFGGRVAPDHIASAVTQARARLGQARIVTYVPILLERFARELLGPTATASEAT